MENLKSRKVILSMQVSLDGYVEGPNGDMNWIIGNEEEWVEMFKDLETADTFITGRKMYAGYADFWQLVLKDPASFPKGHVTFARIAEKTPHILVSEKGYEEQVWHNTRLSNDLVTEIASLKQKPGKNIFVWGGADTATFLINNNLVDEYRLTLNPIILGGGKSLFNNINGRKKLELIESKQMESGLVILKYKPAG